VFINLPVSPAFSIKTRNLAIAIRLCVICTHNTLRASIVTSWPWNLG